MKKTIFKGSGVAIVTPMNGDGSVNLEMLSKLIEFQLANETDAIVVCGTTGEAPTLSQQEHYYAVKCAVDTVAGRVPVIAGTGSNSTAHALELSLEAQKLGVDGLLLVTPYYNKTSQIGLVKHYTHIADRVDIPVILYNVPSRTGITIKPETYLELSKHQNIAAAKEASGDISTLAKTMSLCGENFSIYSGNDEQIVPVLALGGIGVISVLANICPRQCHEITQNFFDGDICKSTALLLGHMELISALFTDVNPIPVKAALSMMGYECGPCRLPLVDMNQPALEKLSAVMKKYRLI